MGRLAWHGADINMRHDALNVDERVEYELEESNAVHGSSGKKRSCTSHSESGWDRDGRWVV